MGGMDFRKREILKYTGDFSQVFGTKEYTLNGGKAEGVRAVDVRNGTGLEFTVLPDRGMDIAWLSYKGTNMSYISKTGIVAPQHYNEEGIRFLRSFHAGFLTTCGLSNVGAANVDEGEAYGLHGRISNTPGEHVSSGVEWQKDLPVMKVKGQLREARVFGENLVLEREISCTAGENRIKITDTVENLGFRKEPLMLLYHFNLGYPLLDADSKLVVPTAGLAPKDEEAQKGINTCTAFQKPTAGYREQVFYHDLKTDRDGNTFAALINDRLGLGVAVRFNKKQLFNMTQWKQMGEGEYVLGIEPCNCFVNGRAAAKEKGQLEYLAPGEKRTFEIELEILDGAAELTKVKNEVNALSQMPAGAGQRTNMQGFWQDGFHAR